MDIVYVLFHRQSDKVPYHKCPSLFGIYTTVDGAIKSAVDTYENTMRFWTDVYGSREEALKQLLDPLWSWDLWEEALNVNEYPSRHSVYLGTWDHKGERISGP